MINQSHLKTYPWGCKRFGTLSFKVSTLSPTSQFGNNQIKSHSLYATPNSPHSSAIRLRLTMPWRRFCICSRMIKSRMPRPRLHRHFTPSGPYPPVFLTRFVISTDSQSSVALFACPVACQAAAFGRDQAGFPRGYFGVLLDAASPATPGVFSRTFPSQTAQHLLPPKSLVL